MKLCIIVPAFNEEASISGVINSLLSLPLEKQIVVVDDGSKDQTSEIVRGYPVTLLRLSVNLGIGGAIQTGYKWAVHNKFTHAIQFDGDGQHLPQYIQALVDSATTTGKNMIIGSRNLSIQSENTSRTRQFGTKLINYHIKFWWRESTISDATSGMRIIEKSLMKLFCDEYPSDYPEPISVARALASGFTVGEIPVEMQIRTGGRSSIGKFDSIKYMIRVISYINLLGVQYLSRKFKK